VQASLRLAALQRPRILSAPVLRLLPLEEPQQVPSVLLHQPLWVVELESVKAQVVLHSQLL
jgi:hypothetical protein